MLICTQEEFGNEIQDVPTGWTLERNNKYVSTANNEIGLYTRVADGTEDGTTADVTTTFSSEGAAQVHRVTDWFGSLSGVSVSSIVESGTASPDPPSLSPSWGTSDTLWFALGSGADDDATLSSAPTNYVGGVGTVSGAGTDLGCEVFSAYRELSAATENPGTFTLSQVEATQSITVAIRPANVTATASLSGSGSFSADSIKGVFGASSVAGLTTFSADSGLEFRLASSLSGLATFSNAAPQLILGGSVSYAVSSNILSDPALSMTSSVTFGGSAEITFNSTVQITAALSVLGIGSISSNGIKGVFSSVNLSTIGELSALGGVQIIGSKTFESESNLVVVGKGFFFHPVRRRPLDAIHTHRPRG